MENQFTGLQFFHHSVLANCEASIFLSLVYAVILYSWSLMFLIGKGTYSWVSSTWKCGSHAGVILLCHHWVKYTSQKLDLVAPQTSKQWGQIYSAQFVQIVTMVCLLVHTTNASHLKLL